VDVCSWLCARVASLSALGVLQSCTAEKLLGALSGCAPELFSWMCLREGGEARGVCLYHGRACGESLDSRGQHT
jgi:hypothetical protein